MTLPPHCPSEEQLVGFVEGSALASERELTRAHIETCGECRAASSALAKLSLPKRAKLVLTADPNALGSGENKDTVKTPQLERLAAGGRVVGKYRLSRLLGKGGMGEVYLGVHELLGRTAAVKILSRQLSDDRESLARFFREAVATSQIKHPGLVHVYDYGQDADGVAFLVMELLVGETLKERLARCGRLSANDTAVFGAQIAGVLDAAHTHGIVHRDLKPANIIVVADEDMEINERAKVLDFGIAKLANRDGMAVELTATGALLGTPVFMSPEQCQSSSDVGSASDVYSLGCLLYRMLAGQPPFVCRTVGELILAHSTRKPEPLGDEVPLFLATLIAQMMRKAPHERPSAETVRTALESNEFDAPSAAEMLEGGEQAGSGPFDTAAEISTPHCDPQVDSVPTLAGPGVSSVPMRATQTWPTPPAPQTTPSPAAVPPLVTPRQPTKKVKKLPWLVAAGGLLAAVVVIMTLTNDEASSPSDPVPQAAAVATGEARSPPGLVPAGSKRDLDETSVEDSDDIPAEVADSPDDALVEVVVRSQPDGASVRLSLDGTVAGETPFVLEGPATLFPVNLWISRSGYKTKKVLVSPKTTRTFKLVRRQRKDPLDKM